MPDSEESQDVGSSEESKGSLESPKQGNNKMKLKSRLSGKWHTLPVENERSLQSREWESEPTNRMNTLGREYVAQAGPRLVMCPRLAWTPVLLPHPPRWSVNRLTPGEMSPSSPLNLRTVFLQ